MARNRPGQSLVEAALVMPLFVMVFFGIVAGWILTVLVPSIYREEIARQDLIRKGAVALVLFAGIACINISL